MDYMVQIVSRSGNVVFRQYAANNATVLDVQKFAGRKLDHSQRTRIVQLAHPSVKLTEICDAAERRADARKGA